MMADVSKKLCVVCLLAFLSSTQELLFGILGSVFSGGDTFGGAGACCQTQWCYPYPYHILSLLLQSWSHPITIYLLAVMNHWPGRPLITYSMWSYLYLIPSCLSGIDTRDDPKFIISELYNNNITVVKYMKGFWYPNLGLIWTKILTTLSLEYFCCCLTPSILWIIWHNILWWGRRWVVIDCWCKIWFFIINNIFSKKCVRLV